MNPVSRRLFLKSGGIALASVGLIPALGPAFLRRAVYGAEPQKRNKVLICLFQRGACDGLSMVTPFGDVDLYKLRPQIAVASPKRGDTDNAALDLDGFFGLHPAMASLLPVYKAGHMAVIHATGSPSGTRSHFDAQDFMESGTPDKKSVPDGWLSRTALLCPEDRAKTKSNPFHAVAVGGAMPRSMQGDANALAIPDLRTFGIRDSAGTANKRGRFKNTAGNDDAMMASLLATGGASAEGGFETLYDKAVGDVLHGTAQESFAAMDQLKRLNVGSYTPAGGAKYPAGKFGTSLQQIAQLIKADVGMQVAFAEMGGWDTHVNQGGANGQLATRLREWSNGIAALYADLGDRMTDVTILTMSEFGRAARQNGGGGTDHGHGAAFLALGADINGGKVLGDWPGLSPEKLYESRDLAVTTDFRAVFSEVATKHLGIPATGIPKLFPGYTGENTGFRGVVRG